MLGVGENLGIIYLGSVASMSSSCPRPRCKVQNIFIHMMLAELGYNGKAKLLILAVCPTVYVATTE